MFDYSVPLLYFTLFFVGGFFFCIALLTSSEPNQIHYLPNIKAYANGIISLCCCTPSPGCFYENLRILLKEEKKKHRHDFAYEKHPFQTMRMHYQTLNAQICTKHIFSLFFCFFFFSFHHFLLLILLTLLNWNYRWPCTILTSDINVCRFRWESATNNRMHNTSDWRVFSTKFNLTWRASILERSNEHKQNSISLRRCCDALHDTICCQSKPALSINQFLFAQPQSSTYIYGNVASSKWKWTQSKENPIKTEKSSFICIPILNTNRCRTAQEQYRNGLVCAFVCFVSMRKCFIWFTMFAISFTTKWFRDKRFLHYNETTLDLPVQLLSCNAQIGDCVLLDQNSKQIKWNGLIHRTEGSRNDEVQLWTG